MKIVKTLDDLTLSQKQKAVLTIGMFDGVHLGHQKVLNTAKEIAEDEHAETLAITFSNHPREVLLPNTGKVQLLTTVEQKLKLLEWIGIDATFVMPFTKELAHKTAYEFLAIINSKCPLSHLVLGYDATLGSDQTNNRENVLYAAERLDINVTYVSEELFEGEPVSSGRIRKALNSGDVALAEKLLGHPL